MSTGVCYKRKVCPLCGGERFFRVTDDLNYPCPLCRLHGVVLQRSDALPVSENFIPTLRKLVEADCRRIARERGL